MRMDSRLKIAFLLALTVPCFSATKKKPTTKEQQEYLQRCPLKVEGKWRLSTIKKLYRGEHYKQSPIVSYNIEEDGRITNVKLVRSSGVPRIDKDFVGQTGRNRYKPRAGGCGMLE